MLISVHIPKTAGTAFRAILSAHFGERLYLDYAERPLAPGFRWRRLKQRLKPEHVAAGFENAYDCAHGHFIADKYDAADRPVRRIAWLRDPVERTISHFSYWKRVPDLRNPDCRMLIERNLSIEDFAALPRMRNVMTRFFGGKKPEDFFFLGTVETMAESLARFHRLTGIAVDAMPIDNRDEDGPYEDGPPHARVSASARQTIDRLNRRDRALYETVNTMLG